VLAAALAASVTGLAGFSAPAYASARPVLSVGGEVTTPASYTAAQLAALPQATVTVKEGGRQVTDTGVLLETLVTAAAPAYPASLLNTKNELLRVTVTARGAGRQVQAHTETGPSLSEVLAVAGVRPGLNTWVAATGNDNYVATVTPAEQLVGGRPLQLSLNEDGQALAQPRLVADGDVKGGRYVSGVVDIYVMSLAWWTSTSGMAPRGNVGYGATSASVRALIPARFAASSGLRWWRAASSSGE
jgi:hypothetical protein